MKTAYMKKFVLAASIASALALTGCDDNSDSDTNVKSVKAKHHLTVSHNKVSVDGDYVMGDTISIEASDSLGYAFDMWAGNVASVLEQKKNKTTIAKV